MKNKTDIMRLYDILDALSLIKKYYTIDPSDELRWNMMLRQMQIIGEAARKLSDDIKDKSPGIPWASIVAMRHILVHEYEGIDPERVIQVLENNIDSLRATIRQLVKQLDPDEKFK